MARDDLAALLAAAGNAPYADAAGSEGAFGLSSFGAEMHASLSALGVPNQLALQAAAMAQKRAQAYAARTPLNREPSNNWLGQMPLGINSGTVGSAPFVVPAATQQQCSGTPVVDFEPFRYVTGWPFIAGAGFLVFQPQMGINGSFASGAGVDASTLQAAGQGLTVKFPLVRANTPVFVNVQNYSATPSQFTSTMYGHVQQ